MNPMWIISLFLGISEITVGVAAVQASGWIQGLLAVFSVVFPVLVSVVFFLTLWNKPYVLYAPRDFSEVTNVRAYVDAMSVTQADLGDIEPVLVSAVEAAMSKFVPASTSQEEVREGVKEAIKATSETVVEKFVTILCDNGHHLRFDPASRFEDIEELFQYVWYKNYVLADTPDSYGREWALRDLDNGRTLDTPDHMNISLQEFGIRPGSRLTVVNRTYQESR